MNKIVRLGTRESALATWQAKSVENELNQHNIKTEIIKIKSEGDLNTNKPLYEFGVSGIFTKSLDIALLNNKIDSVPTTKIPIFNLEIPTELNEIDANIFDPRKSWASDITWENKAIELAKLFIANFDQFCDSENGKNLVKFGPQV